MLLKDYLPHLTDELVDSQLAESFVNTTTILEWFCAVGHSYFSAVGDRRRGYGCPFCSQHRVWLGEEVALRNDLAHVSRERAARLEHGAFGRLVTGSSLLYALCSCEKGHRVASKVKHIRRCAYCHGHALAEDNALFHERAALKNALADDRDYWGVKSKASALIEFVCGVGHSYVQNLSQAMAKDLGCPACRKRKIVPNEAYTRKGARFVSLAEKELSYGGGIPAAYRNDIWATHPALARRLAYPQEGFFRTIETPTVVTLICEGGHSFGDFLSAHAKGFTCVFCLGLAVYFPEKESLTVTHPEVAALLQKRLHGDTVTAKSPITLAWQCPRGHREEKKVREKVVKGTVCEVCVRESGGSLLELEVFRFVRSLGYSPKGRSRKLLRTKELDIYLEKEGIALEVNGDYWHSEVVSRGQYGISAHERHELKRSLAKDKGVKVFFLWEYQWIEKRDRAEEEIKRVLAGKTSVFLSHTTLPPKREAYFKKSPAITEA